MLKGTSQNKKSNSSPLKAIGPHKHVPILFPVHIRPMDLSPAILISLYLANNYQDYNNTGKYFFKRWLIDVLRSHCKKESKKKVKIDYCTLGKTSAVKPHMPG